jgi:hypothetical protein
MRAVAQSCAPQKLDRSPTHAGVTSWTRFSRPTLTSSIRAETREGNAMCAAIVVKGSLSLFPRVNEKRII